MIRIGTLALAALAMTSTVAPARTSPDQPGIVRQVRPAIHRFTVGEASVTVLSDGSVPLDLHKVLRGATRGEIDASLSRSFLTNSAETSINAFLIELGDRRILVDTGAGELFGPGVGGRLPEALEAAGVAPATITDILISHVHSDHSGGLARGGRMLFPQATVHVGGPDVRFYSDVANAASSGQEKRLWIEADRTLKPYLEAGKVKAFEDDGEILSGIRAELHPGHTPGSATYTLTSAGSSIVFIGDLVHVGPVQFANPSVTIAFDLDQAKARDARRNVLARLAGDRALTAGPHLPFPGVGHIARAGKAYRWVPMEYGDRAQARER